jgi:hemoglobin
MRNSTLLNEDPGMTAKKMKNYVVQSVLTLGLLTGGASTAIAAGDDPLFDRLGGMPAITAVVDQFFVNNFADERIATRWGTSDLPKLKENISNLICDVTGGPCVYSGSSMEVAHNGMNITADEFGWTASNLSAALDSLNVPEPEKGELLAIVGSLQDQMVGK